MNILRVSTLSLTLAIAVFALGYANLAFAGKPVKCDDWPACKDDGGGEDKTETDFMVELVQGGLKNDSMGNPPEGLVTSFGACGITKGELHDGVRFPDGCVTVLANFKTDLGSPLILRLFGFDVRDNRSEAEASLFFYDEEIVFPLRNQGDGYGIQISGEPPVTVIRNGSITVKVNRSGLYLIKVHQPRKGDLVGPIAVGEIVYTPIPIE